MTLVCARMHAYAASGAPTTSMSRYGKNRMARSGGSYSANSSGRLRQQQHSAAANARSLLGSAVGSKSGTARLGQGDRSAGLAGGSIGAGGLSAGIGSAASAQAAGHGTSGGGLQQRQQQRVVGEGPARRLNQRAPPGLAVKVNYREGLAGVCVCVCVCMCVRV